MSAGMRPVPLVLAAGSIALVVSTARPAPPPEQRVELEVAGVLPMPQGAAGLLVLREKGAGTLLPVLVPDAAALSASTQRSGAPDAGLLGRAIEALGGRVREVEIERAEETVTGARVRLRQGTRDLELRARPSESVALAVASGARIVATRRLLAASGLTPDELRQGAAKARGPSTAM